MNKYIHIQRPYGILNKVKIGFEFEFFTKLNSRKLMSEFKKTLGVKVTTGVKERSFTRELLGYNTEFTPTDKVFKLEKDYSGGPDMYELITGPIGYFDARKILILTLKKIQEIGMTNDRCGLHINISFDDSDLNATHINILKFCIDFLDVEKDIYKDFPSRKNNIYTNSIARIVPDFNYVQLDLNNLSIEKMKFLLPLESRYFGVNFKNLKKNYLEFRYIGGSGYEKKLEKILDYTDTFIYLMYENITNTNINSIRSDKFINTIRKKISKIEAFKNYDKFKQNYPDINLSVDLKRDPGLLKMYFNDIRALLYELIIINGMKSGGVNYDSDISKLQVRDAKLNNLKVLWNIELFSCEISGFLESCGIYNCIIKNSIIGSCEITGATDIKNSKIYNSSIGSAVNIDNCYIQTRDKKIKGIITRSIISGPKELLSGSAELDNQTEFAGEDMYGKSKK